jgi:N-methylhydantoinase A
MRYMLGVDVGGTFTDLTFIDADTRVIQVHKLPSTPDDPSRAIIQGIGELLERLNMPASNVDYLAHGTTVATNTLIERTGARTGLLVTEGFGDLLEIGNQMRPSLYNLQRPKPEPLVPGELRQEVQERVYASGAVRTPLDQISMDAAVKRLSAADVEAVAICFMFSFVNPEHERIARDAVQAALPNAYVTASHEIVPEFREYPRLSTTVLNAYLGPVMKRYLSNFHASIAAMGIRSDPYVTQSNGGILSVNECIHTPIRTAMSGPSAGVIAAAHLGKLTGFDNLITLDLGGTSADISLIYQGEPLMSVERTVEDFPARIPMLDIVTIGAGGGSIAWLDAGGALKVGPRSAGAVPGPACYRRGGTLPTVSDANLVLGRMSKEGLLGGTMPLDVEAAEESVQKHIADPIHTTVIEAADGIINVVNANMVRAIRRVTVERGYDPREFALMAFGGAGPMHAVAVAYEIGIPTVIVPTSPGMLCSFGLLFTDVRTDYVRSLSMIPSETTLPTMQQFFRELSAEAHQSLDREAIPQQDRSLVCKIEARYKRQNYELAIQVDIDELTPEHLPEILERFHQEHERVYGYAKRQAPLEFVNYRLTAIGALPKPVLPHANGDDAPLPQPHDERPVYFSEARGFVSCPIYLRATLRAGKQFSGPAIIEQLDATTLIPPNVTWEIDAYGTIIIHLNRG